MQVIAHPNPALKQRADHVDPKGDRELLKLATQMAKLMYAAHGVGLAATQVGVQKRIIVFDLGDEHQPVAVCNPVIVERSEETELDDEGCLSLPGISVPIERAVSCVCEGVDLRGDLVRIEAEALMARVLQHETDHLDGILILDRATPDERKAAIKRYMEAMEADSAV
jgi:peptide deformylase